jgi:hypothetical protein
MTEQAKPYVPLTSDNAALLLVDHQVGLMTGVRDYSTGELKQNVVALAKAAKALKVPMIVTTTARDSMWGPTFPELVKALPGIQIIDRSSVNAWDDAKVAAAIEATGRKKLIFAGLSLEGLRGLPRHHCQSASKWDPRFAFKKDPTLRQSGTTARGLAELVRFAQPGRARWREADL